MEKSPLALQTDHAANIFGVQFMPCTNNRQIITGAMDDTVMLHNIERLPAQLARRGNGSPLPVAFQSTMFGCHRARVKVMSRFPVLSVCTQGACAGCIHGSEGCWPHVYEPCSVHQPCLAEALCPAKSTQRAASLLQTALTLPCLTLLSCFLTQGDLSTAAHSMAQSIFA